MNNTTILDNRVLIAAFLAWAIAQVSKTILELFKQRKLALSRLVSSGGCPVLTQHWLLAWRPLLAVR
ncbi:hypothetical protein KDK_12190 [Dictyobacter kobayashii]|uniref:Uncharacterized protein n=1 Tax=Dictyobacter kobayashii TaxID=2014872 RepID=A0A402AE89_9CHLR|nr:divergent PAP2 family protein [Dictyobacter kobayashii]GCE17419.1 hypothetical protein KDK_12190 [Dictyobacter kobayashii]